MKHINKIIIVVFLILIYILYLAFIGINSSKTNTNRRTNDEKIEDLINISDCTEEFMENYFEEVKKINESENKDNILIVSSKNKPNNLYGATDVVSGPNNQYFLQYSNKKEKDFALNKLKADKSLIVEENIVRNITEDDTVVTSYNSWGVTTMGLDTMIEKMANHNLNNVVVAIIDTGLDMELFSQKFPGRLVDGYNVINPDSDIIDGVGHGTHIAGTIAECTLNNVKIMPIRVSSTGRFYSSDAITGINYATYANVDTMNMSYGGGAYSYGEHVAIEAAKQKNIIEVAAAGNENTNTQSYPAALESTISISAVDSNKNKAEFSNYGKSIMFAAPGVDILSINGTKSGTSMATPHAVSAVALLKSMNKALTFNDTVTLLQRNAEDLGSTGWDEYFGYGFINLANAELANSNQSDEFGIFETTSNYEEIVKDYSLTGEDNEYDYGSINNILERKIVINYTNGRTDKYTLDELTDLEINGYDSKNYNKQTIRIKLTTPLGYQIDDLFDINVESIYKDTYKRESVWEYNLIGENEIELTGFKDTNMTFENLYFPNEIDGYTVTGIADLDESMFSNTNNFFEKVKKIYLPDTIKKIGNNAFCKSNTTTSCTSLSYIKSDAEGLYVGNASFANTSLKKLDAKKISYIGDRAFLNTEELENITFSNDIAYIGNGAFYNSLYGAKITIPESATNISDTAFEHSEIKEIVFLNSMKKIEDKMFYECHNLEKVVCSNDLEKIGELAFGSCNNLKEIYFKKGVTAIDDMAFSSTGGQFKFYVYNNTYPQTYAIEKHWKYQTIDPTDIVVNVEKSEYKASEKVNPTSDIVSIKLYYDEGKNIDNTYTEIQKSKEEIIDSEYTIIYCNQADSFRTGDEYYIIKGINQYGIEFEKQVNVTVNENVKTIIYPNITISNKVYDGTTKIPDSNIMIDNLDISEYTIVSATTSSAEVGEQIATIILRLSDSKFEEYTFDNGLQEEEFSTGITIIENNIIGDVNGNGTVDLTDYSMILKHVKGIKTLTGEQLDRADVNGNGSVDMTDYSMVLKHVKGIKLLN